MRLVEELSGLLAREASPFRAQLLREDIARLSKVLAMARERRDLAEFRKQALYAGWTRDDMRTHELKEPLDKLLAAIHRSVGEPQDRGAEEAVTEAWVAFNRARIAKLIGCL